MMHTLRLCLLHLTLVLATTVCVAQPQTGPWNSPLLIAEEIAPDVFGPPRIFQDSSGVPCVVRKPGTDTMYCVFQWFREPRNTPTWDRIATKKSFDEGATWTEPDPIVVDGLPAGYQRPFDPTIVCFGDSMRLYFSSSARFPMMGLDPVVNTYSAVGTDGVHFAFEPGIRFDNATRPVIDPAVHYTNGNWRFIAPIGAPQEGAYQGISMDGLQFTLMENIASDNTHNWTGNIMSDDNGQMHFYGSGPELWRSPDSVFGRWGMYRALGLRGGDPSAVQRTDGRRMIVYVGPRYVTSVDADAERSPLPSSNVFSIAPNPANEFIRITPSPETSVAFWNTQGECVTLDSAGGSVDVRGLANGVYALRAPSGEYICSFIKFN